MFNVPAICLFFQSLNADFVANFRHSPFVLTRNPIAVRVDCDFSGCALETAAQTVLQHNRGIPCRQHIVPVLGDGFVQRYAIHVNGIVQCASIHGWLELEWQKWMSGGKWKNAHNAQFLSFLDPMDFCYPFLVAFTVVGVPIQLASQLNGGMLNSAYMSRLNWSNCVESKFSKSICVSNQRVKICKKNYRKCQSGSGLRLLVASIRWCVLVHPYFFISDCRIDVILWTTILNSNK